MSGQPIYTWRTTIHSSRETLHVRFIGLSYVILISFHAENILICEYSNWHMVQSSSAFRSYTSSLTLQNKDGSRGGACIFAICIRMMERKPQIAALIYHRCRCVLTSSIICCQRLATVLFYNYTIITWRCILTCCVNYCNMNRMWHGRVERLSLEIVIV